MQTVPASTQHATFTCPNPDCTALSPQKWHSALGVERDAPPHDEDIQRLPGARSDNIQKLTDLFSGVYLPDLGMSAPDNDTYEARRIQRLWIAECFACKKLSIWVDKELVYPLTGTADMPNEDLPPDIKNDFLEARAIEALSPRGAGALLRLALQKLCVELGQPGKNLNADIGALVAKGMSVKVQQAFDVIRLAGNGMVHPDKDGLGDTRETASMLFGLINLIAHEMISEPKRLNEFYLSLPEDKRKQVEDRNAKAIRRAAQEQN